LLSLNAVRVLASPTHKQPLFVERELGSAGLFGCVGCGQAFSFSEISCGVRHWLSHDGAMCR
jgi:hypothetical protein